MTYSKSGWFVQTLLHVFSNTTETGTPTLIAPLASSTNDTNTYLSLVSSSASDYTAPVNTTSATLGVWANTDEVTGTNWATGGVELATAYSGGSVTSTLAIGGSGPAYLQYSWTNALTVASTTISTAIYGFIIYFKNITAPLSKPELLTIYVGGSGGYTTSNGTLSITPSGSGLSQLTVTG